MQKMYFKKFFIKYSQKMPKFENEEHEKAWFIRVTINLTKNLHNQAWNRKTVPLEETIQFEEKEEENIFQIVKHITSKLQNSSIPVLLRRIQDKKKF